MKDPSRTTLPAAPLTGQEMTTSQLPDVVFTERFHEAHYSIIKAFDRAVADHRLTQEEQRLLAQFLHGSLMMKIETNREAVSRAI